MVKLRYEIRTDLVSNYKLLFRTKLNHEISQGIDTDLNYHEILQNMILKLQYHRIHVHHQMISTILY